LRPRALKQSSPSVDQTRMRHAIPALVLALAACQVSTRSSPAPTASTRHRPTPSDEQLDLPVAHAPFDTLQANWKQRLDQPYVYVEDRGDYRGIGKLLERAFAAADAAHVEASGPPFALYYDDPGKVAVDELRMRACLPVASPIEAREPLHYDVLDSTTVVYAYIGGPYPEVPRAYPGVFAFLKTLDWVENGPVREIYLRDPSEVASWDELVTEVQIPATRRP
jgi:effector-binding domain-containing protein